MTATSDLVDVSVPALILKIGRYPLHHGGVGVARSLGRLGVPVHAVLEDRFTPAAMSRYVRFGFVWSSTGLEDTRTLIGGILSIGERLGRPCVLIPTDDEAAVLIAEHAPALRGAFLYPWSSDPGLPRRVASKLGLHELCIEHGVPSPTLICPPSAREMEEIAQTVTYPLVAKHREAFSRKRTTELPRISLITSAEELMHLARRLPEDPGVVLQEYLPLEEAEDWIFHGYFGMGSTGPAFTGVKVRSFPPHAGVTACGYVVDNPELATLSSEFCRRLGFRGIVDLDWRYDRRDGQYKLLDFNPRVGAQFRLFENEHGIDVVRAQHLDVTGRPVPQGRTVAKRFVVENLDVRARPRYRDNRYSTPSVPSAVPPTELAWFAADDMGPSVAMALRTGNRAAVRLLPRAHPVRSRHREGSEVQPVAVIGAGPYGLSTGAHLEAAGVPVRVFGDPMSAWRIAMPRGMILKSSPLASTISAPEPGHALQDFCEESGQPRLETDRQVVPIDTFLRYGAWFQKRVVPHVENTTVTSVESRDGAFVLQLSSAERVTARAVVVATGLSRFAHVPAEMRSAMPEVPSPDGPVSHVSQHADLAAFAGREVLVVGAGQSALESAALLHEAGADVRVLARRPAIHFATPPGRGPYWQPWSPLGRKWSYYALSRHAAWFRQLPAQTRLRLVQQVLGPSGAWWLKERVVGRVPVTCASHIESLRLDGPRPALRLAGPDGTAELSADHVLLATGYRVDLDRLDFLGQELRGALARTGGSPRLDAGLQSSVPGLYFTGLPAAATFGPLLRFVCGTAFAAPRLAAAIRRAR